MKSYLFKLVLICSFLLAWACTPKAQLTINITSIPQNTPQGALLYIAGNFNGWDPGDPAYQLTDSGNGSYTITFSPSPGLLEYKFTRGNWATVEGTAESTYRPNRTYTYSGNATTIETTIDGWEDGIIQHTATANVHILSEDYLIPELNRTRRIWIYLPPDYETSSKRYPVIYMHDGQNLFDQATSFAGEWKVDETLNALFDEGDYGAIVVGVDNGGQYRFDEYCPWINPSYGGGQGDEYVHFMVNNLKPHIDSVYRTLTGPAYTAIAGSSMGGLISMYAIAEYPDIFSKAGVFSPAFWVADSIFPFVESKTFVNPMRVYFVAGATESADMIPDMNQMYNLLLAEGLPESELLFDNEADGAHSEWFWAREFPKVYKWLFDNIVLDTPSPRQKKTEVGPNPVTDFITVTGFPERTNWNLFDITGRQITSGLVEHQRIDLSTISMGLYVLYLSDQTSQTHEAFRIFKN